MSTPTLLTADGIVCEVSDDCAKRLGRPKADMKGRHLFDLCPRELGEELSELLRKHTLEQTPFVALLLLNGVWSILLFRPHSCACGDPHVAFECMHECDWHAIEEGVHGVTFYKLKYRDLGPLADLTVRELEVLKLIGHGLTTREIAAELHRSERTIQGHRISLGKKLNCQTRTDLARIAADAGLPSVGLQDLAEFRN